MRNTPKPRASKSDWKKISPCLCRFKQGDYYALVKRKGKQIRRTFRTSDLATVRRNHKQFLADMEWLDLDHGRQTLETFAPTRSLATTERYLQGQPLPAPGHGLPPRRLLCQAEGP